MPRYDRQPTGFDMNCGVKPALLALAVTALMLPAAQAQEDELPLFLTASQTFTRDSNLFKDDTRKESDSISSTAARFGLNKNYGRQQYRLDVTASHNKYSKNDQLDYNGLVSSAEFVTDLASSFRLTADAALSDLLPKFEDNRNQEAQRRSNTQTIKRAGLDLRYGLYGRMSVNAGYSQSDVSYRVTKADNRDSNTWQVGLRYQPHDLLFYGLTYSQTNSDLPDRITPEEIKRRNLSLVANWRVTGFSVLSSSLGYSRERYEVDPARDFNGVTGSAAWTFTPAGKVTYRVNWRRDTNNEGGRTFFSSGTSSLTSGANRVTNQLSASATWQATSKISSTATLTHVRYEEESNFTSVSKGIERTDSQDTRGRLNAVSLGVDYQPMRSLAVGCDLQHYDRTQSAFSQAYSGRTVSCSLGFTLD